MVTLEDIKLSLYSNNNLTDEIREKFLGLIKVFNKKFSSVSLDKLNEKLKTVSFGKIGKFEKKGVYLYNVIENKILFSQQVKENYDIDHLLMKSILQMATSTDTFTGFNSDDRLRALNLAYTEILANYIIGNEGTSDLEEEVLVANLIGHIIGNDILFNSYFTNNGEPIIKAMKDLEVGF